MDTTPTQQVRIRAIWSDSEADHIFVLEKWYPSYKLLFITIPENWACVSRTILLSKAESWAKHYGVAIEWPNQKKEG